MALSKLPRQLQSSIYYHNIFDFALTENELERWTVGKKNLLSGSGWEYRDKFYFVKGRRGLIKLKIQRGKYSNKKTIIAKKAAKILKIVPTIKFVGVTGSLAMNSASKTSDIDLLIITSKGSLWTTRLISYVVLKTVGFSIRKPQDKDEKDKLCLNMWMDESDLYFDKHNIFTSHELAQIRPLVNKTKTYERLISNNNWIFDYWPKAVDRYKKVNVKFKNNPMQIIENFCRQIQWKYMRSKRTREVVNETRAFFHPFDWGKKIQAKLKNYYYKY